MNRRELLLALGGAAAPLSAAPRKTVLLELFTSQGCSSCPPAEDLLVAITRNAPAGVRVIALAEHVDYWDHLGWRDSLAIPVCAARQRAYAEKFKQDSVYTPQFIANGVAIAPGNDRDRLVEAVRAASRTPLIGVDVQRKTGERHQIRIRVEESPQYADATLDVLLAVVEVSVAAHVSRGENAGRSFEHPYVVRSLTGLESLEARKTRSCDVTIEVPFAKSWVPERMLAVVFLQDRSSGVISGVAGTAL